MVYRLFPTIVFVYQKRCLKVFVPVSPWSFDHAATMSRYQSQCVLSYVFWFLSSVVSPLPIPSTCPPPPPPPPITYIQITNFSPKNEFIILAMRENKLDLNVLYFINVRPNYSRDGYLWGSNLFFRKLCFSTLVYSRVSYVTHGLRMRVLSVHRAWLCAYGSGLLKCLLIRIR